MPRPPRRPRRRVRLAAAALALAGCAAPAPAGAPAPPALGRDAARALAEQRRGQPLLLPTPGVPPAPWLAPAAPAPDTPPIDRPAPVAVGVDAAIASTTAGLFALHRRFGVVGPLRPPGDVRWIGLDERDRVCVATADGALHRAESVRAALEATAFEPLARVPGAIAWDASAGWIAAATVDEVLLSHDGGRTFPSAGRIPGAALQKVFVRSDGVAAAQGAAAGSAPPVTWVGRRGRPFRPARDAPEDLSRVGDRIGGVDLCPMALSTDGVRWAHVEAWPNEAERAAWTRVFWPTGELTAFTADFTGSLVDPPPPPPPAAGAAPSGLCTHRTKAPRIHMGTTELPHNHCAAAAYLAGTTERPPPPAAVELALLRDGRCAPEDEDPRGSMPGRCKPSAPLSRPPGVAVLDRAAGRVSVAAVPAGCRPERLLSAGGVGLLFCASPGRPDQTDLFVADRSAAWVAEGPLPVAATDVSSLSMAPDGTLLVRAAWGRRPEYRAFVRSPRPLGDATAWRALDLAGAFEVRVDLGGGAVLFETSATAVLPGWFTVWLDGPEMPRAQLSGRIPVHGSLLDAEIEGRRIALWQHHDVLSGDCDLRAGPAPRHASSKWLLTEAGGVAPAPIGGATPRP